MSLTPRCRAANTDPVGVTGVAIHIARDSACQSMNILPVLELSRAMWIATPVTPTVKSIQNQIVIFCVIGAVQHFRSDQSSLLRLNPTANPAKHLFLFCSSVTRDRGQGNLGEAWSFCTLADLQTFHWRPVVRVLVNEV